MFRKTLLIALLVSLLPMALWAAGGSSAPTAPTKSPAEEAKELYNRGLELRDKAWSLEEKAQGLSGAERDKVAAKIEKTYRKAAERFSEATSKNARFHQAYSSLGYALRKVGDYEDSLRAYNQALELAPTYAEAIEYRGEAYLGLGRLEDAKEAYLSLFTLDRARADELLAAMQTWLESNPGEEGFASWVAERAKIASQTASLSQLSTRRW
ncbi:MAG: tetratricopeptide repeat protein [Acidobacteriota bacterium]